MWSLGCILYQMVYGKAPFAKLDQHKKYAAITSNEYEIKYAYNTAGIVVDSAVISSMQGCLQRDPFKRQTIAQLQKHPFVHARSGITIALNGRLGSQQKAD